MAKNIEQLLRLAADYHRFCFDEYGEEESHQDQNELSLDELDVVFAAGTTEHLLDAQQVNRKWKDEKR